MCVCINRKVSGAMQGDDVCQVWLSSLLPLPDLCLQLLSHLVVTSGRTQQGQYFGGGSEQRLGCLAKKHCAANSCVFCPSYLSLLPQDGGLKPCCLYQSQADSSALNWSPQPWPG